MNNTKSNKELAVELTLAYISHSECNLSETTVKSFLKTMFQTLNSLDENSLDKKTQLPL